MPVWDPDRDDYEAQDTRRPDDPSPPQREPEPQPQPQQTISPPQTPDERRETIGRHVEEEYRSRLGRAPDANERTTDVANYEKYGGEALRAVLARRAGNVPTGTTTNQPNPKPDPRFPGGEFNDPYTSQYEGLLGSQLELLRMQQEEMRAAAEAAKQKRAAAEAAWNRFSGYANERVTKLQGPAYTGSEQEVLRGQLLDPIERDRSAAQKRALERISSRGFEVDSGLAQELQRLVDQEYNQYRSGAQGALAQRQIEEQRSREQEAQQLLATLAQIPDALARGDLDFVNYVQGLIAQPGTQRIAIGNILSELPSRRLQEALQVLGVAPQGLGPMGNNNAQLMQLLQLLQSQRFGQNQQWGNLFGGLGLSFMPR